MAEETRNNQGFSPVKRKRVSEAIYEQIENMIIKGELRPGDKLPSERQMMSLYKRSLPTVRESLRMLESAGYITVIPGEGAVVREPDINPLGKPLVEFMKFKKVPFQDIYEFMQQTEPIFVAEAAQRRTWEDIVSLEKNLSDMYKSLDEAYSFYSAYFMFHKSLMHATHNPLISIAWDAILEVLPGLPDAVENSKLPGLLEEYQMHQQLFAAVRESDEIRASEILNQCWEKWPFPLHENE